MYPEYGLLTSTLVRHPPTMANIFPLFCSIEAVNNDDLGVGLAIYKNQTTVWNIFK